MNSMYYLQVDEIDHVTIQYTDFAKPLDKEKSVRFILMYNAWYESVADVLDGVEINEKSLSERSEKELYEILVKIRTVLLDMAFSK